MFLRLTIQIIVFFATLVSPVLGVLSAHAGCSTYRSPQKVWFNEYFFGVGANNPPNFLELYTTSPAFQTQWPGSTVEVYSAANTKKTYTFTSTTATACTLGNKTWITYNVLGGLESNQALIILRDPSGDAIDAFVFDNQAPPGPWQSATVNWAPGQTTGCAALDTALSNQAAAATQPSKQTNMLILQNYGNKDLARVPDGGSIWDVTSNTGSGTTYTQCVSNNANLTKTVDYFTPSPGNTITFTLSIANTGNSALTGITLDDFLPDYTYSDSVDSMAPTYISAIPVNPSDSVTITSYTTVDPNPIIGGTPTNTPATATKITWAPASIAAGTTAILHIKMQLPNNAIPGYFYQNIAQTTGGLTPNQTDFVDFTVGSQNVGSFVITVNPATASTCTPALLGPQVTITAMTGPNGTGNVDTAYTGENSSGNSVVYLSASSANLTWHDSSGDPIPVSPAPANSFVNGVATFYLTGSTAETISVSALDTFSYTPNLMQGASGNITFTSGSGGLTLTDADTLVPTYGVIAGRPHQIQATISQCGEPATGKTGQYSGTIRYTAGLNHPVGATAPTISTTGTCPGTIGPLATGSGTAITLGFTAGISNFFYLCTSDVGQYTLNLSLTLPNPGGGTFTGSSGNFTVRPFVITARSFAVGGSPNPMGSAPADPVFTNAGTTFSGTFDAWSWRSNEDSDNNGIPDPGIAAAAFSTATHLRLPRFSGTTNNAGVITFAPKLNTPAGGISGEFISPSPSPAIASSGTVTLGTFTSSEVGSITIGGVDPGGTYGATNYLGMSGLHVPILSDVIGRFVPHHFDTEVSNACGTFSYSGQPFPAKITAKNISGVTTQNYTNTFAKNVTFSDTNGATGTFSPAPLPASAFIAGVADKSIPPYSVNFTFTDKLTIPATIKLHAADTDNVTSTTGTEGTTPIRSGRLVLQNAYGTEAEDHTMSFLAQFFGNTSQWSTNTEDNCTTLVADNFNFKNYLQDLTITEMDRPHIDTSLSTLTTIGGRGSLYLKKPSLGDSKYVGSVDICADLGPDTPSLCVATSANMPWLQGRWSETDYDDDPTGRANFGIYRGNDRIINWREIIR